MEYTMLELVNDILLRVKVPLKPSEIWQEAEKIGLAEKVDYKGKMPWRGVTAAIYSNLCKRSNSIIIFSEKPSKFALEDYESTQFSSVYTELMQGRNIKNSSQSNITSSEFKEPIERKAWLLPWTSESEGCFDYQGAIKSVSLNEFFYTKWVSGSNFPQIYDDVYIISIDGRHKKEVIASGKIIKETYIGKNWDNNNKKDLNYIDIELDKVIDLTTSTGMQIVSIKNAFNITKLDTTNYMIEIEKRFAKMLNAMWEKHYDTYMKDINKKVVTKPDVEVDNQDELLEIKKHILEFEEMLDELEKRIDNLGKER